MHTNVVAGRIIEAAPGLGGRAVGIVRNVRW
jgi:hypothetical protein